MSGYTVRLYQQGDAEEMHAAALESVAEVYPWMAWCHRREGVLRNRLLLPSGPSDAVMYSLVRPA